MKIKEIVEVFFVLPKDTGSSDADVTNIMIMLENLTVRKLGAGSNEDIDYILSKILQIKEQGILKNHRTAVFYLIGSVKNFVDEKHLERISQILFWDEILLSRDRSIRDKIIYMLKKIGNDFAVTTLKKLAVEIRKVEYKPTSGELFPVASPEEMAKMDQEDIEKALKAIKKRKEYC